MKRAQYDHSCYFAAVQTSVENPACLRTNGIGETHSPLPKRSRDPDGSTTRCWRPTHPRQRPYPSCWHQTQSTSVQAVLTERPWHGVVCRSLLRHAGPGDGRTRHLVTASAYQPPQSGCADQYDAFVGLPWLPVIVASGRFPESAECGSFASCAGLPPLVRCLPRLSATCTHKKPMPVAVVTVLSLAQASDVELYPRMDVCPCSMRRAGNISATKARVDVNRAGMSRTSRRTQGYRRRTAAAMVVGGWWAGRKHLVTKW